VAGRIRAGGGAEPVELAVWLAALIVPLPAV
jgi:hypothetical protein